MKVILNEEVYNLGEEGDVCKVADGYARNYLLPRKLAVPYNRATVALFEDKKAAIEKRKEEKRKAAMSLKEKLEGLVLKIEVTAGDTGKLFGSVTNAVIAEALQKEGITVERKKIDVPSSTIKMVGTYPVKVRLYDNQLAEMKVEVVGPGGLTQAEAQKAQEEEKKAAEEAEAAKVAKAKAAAEAAEAEAETETETDDVEETEVDASEAEAEETADDVKEDTSEDEE